MIIAVLIIGGSMFMSLMVAGSLDNDDNVQFAVNWAISIFIDLAILEMILVAIGGFFTSLVGKDPIALGGLRNIVLALGPKGLRKAVIR